MKQNLDVTAQTLTKTLCEHLAAVRFADLSPEAVLQARRGVLDWIGCAVAAASHPTVARLIAVLQEIGGRPQATVLGNNLKLGMFDAPLANGQMGHLLDFDDTHMGGQMGSVVLHASSPILAALFSLAERDGSGGQKVSGANLMLAYAVGFEAGVRCGLAAPGHHKGGWHLTGTLGSFAAAAACGKLIGLDAQRLTYAMGIAGTQAAGMQQNRGTMCKSFHAGKAAHNGLLAAMLAERGFDSTQEIIEGRRGFCRIYSDVAAPDCLTAGLGERWFIETNGHKPYACGVVLHPLIDAVIALRNRDRIEAAAVTEIALRAHPFVLSITDVTEPASGLQSKFSGVHSAAVALIDGVAGIAQYSDAKAADPMVAALRRLTTIVADATLGSDEAYATIIAGAVRHDIHIPHASGTAANPMSDDAIAAKFMANATNAIGQARAEQARDLIWELERADDVRGLIELLG
jgi:2-methylcitrate dehydratase PrpD